mmetsp:Transcript_9334/g.16285  ORF Transcript_9334/g.16285 Transcript_9334/m.16285 type:complete len:116 (+) Transcript_9334:3-350(+)
MYFERGGFFWVLVDSETDAVVGTVGLEKIKETEGELRRMCLVQHLRKKGWGTHLGKTLQDKARDMGLKRVFCSTPEHGEDVLQFYSKKLGFTEFGERQEIHDSPIKEVFLEWNVV